MNDSEIKSSVDDIELESPSDRDDAGIVDAETNLLRGANQATISNLSTSVNALTRPLVSQQLTETIRALTRPLVSQQLTETIRALTRPLVSQQLTETIRALTRPLVSQQLTETIRALNRPLVSQQLTETIRALNRPLVSQQLTETIRALNRPLVSQQLTETIRALNRPLVNAWYMEPTVSLNFAPTIAATREEHEIWSSLVVADAEDHSLTGERSHWLTVFDALVKDDGLRRASRSLFANGYYALAVQRAWTYIDNLVRDRSGCTDKSGADLMRVAFSPNNPVLKLNALQSMSEKNQQQGYMHIFEGTMIGIRNPRSHEHDLEDGPEEALEMLVLASHLIRTLNRSVLA